MGYALIWIESLAASLLLAAAAAALWTRTSARMRVFACCALSALAAWLLLATQAYRLVCDRECYSALSISFLVLECGGLFFWIRRKGWAQPSGALGVLATLAVVLVLLILPGIALIFSSIMAFEFKSTHSWFGYTLSWVLVYLAGTGWMLREAWRRKEDGARASLHWPLNRLGLAAAAAVMVSAMTLWNLDLGVCARLSEMRTEASAMALAVAPPRLNEQENAALVYLQAFEAMPDVKRWPQDWTWVIGRTPQMSPIDMGANNQLLSAYLAAHEESIKLLHRAAGMSGCEFERDWSQGNSMPLSDLAKMRNSARLLCIDARRKAALGNLKAAFQDVGAIYGISRHLRRDPIMLSCLVANAVDAIGTSLMSDLAETSRPSPEDLCGFELDDVVSYSRSFVRCLQMEEALGIVTFASVSQGDTLNQIKSIGSRGFQYSEPELLGELLSPFIRLFLLPDDLDRFRAMIHDARQMALMPYHESQGAWEQRFAENEGERDGLISSTLMSGYSRIRLTFALADARYRIARTLLALIRYRAAKGACPDKLTDLTPAFLAVVPNDPFDGKPLRYATTAEGSTLYSIGSNRRDDGGELSESGTEKDLGVRLSRIMEKSK